MPDNNYHLTQVTRRYTIDRSDKEGYFYAHLHEAGSDKEFIGSIHRSFEENSFNPKEFEGFGIEIIVDYIQRTHVLYLQKILPEIEQSILLLSEQYASGHPLLQQLHSFFYRYYQELTTHVNEEENKLLPYIVLLRNAEQEPRHFSEYVLFNGKYSVRAFLDEHHDTEDELMEIRETIRLYTPPPTNQSLYRILLVQLQAFEQDLHLHACMEEEVLIPKALQIEHALHARFLQSARRN